MTKYTNTYHHGEEVTITATPDYCCDFAYWIDENEPCVPVSYDPTLTFVASEDVSYAPVFSRKRFRVEIGTNEPDFCCITGNGYYECGEDVTVSVSTGCCNSIEWSDGALNTVQPSCQSGVRTITHTIHGINEDFSVNAVVTLGESVVSVSACPENCGSVVVITAANTSNRYERDFLCGEREWSLTSPCEYEGVVSNGSVCTVTCGSEVAIVAYPFEGYVFTKWVYGDDCADCITAQAISTNPVLSFAAETDRTYVACFAAVN